MKKLVSILYILTLTLYSYAQNWQWAKSIHGPNSDFALIACVDNQGNSYVIGAFQSNTCIFDTDTLNGSGYSTHYLAKYSPSGNIIWAKKTGNSFSLNCNSGIFKLVYDSLSNSLLFAGAVGSNFQLNSTTVTSSPGDMDAIFGKANLNGDVLWYHTITGNGSQSGNTIDFDGAGNVYAIGTSNSAFNVGNDSLQAGVFLIKYDSNGNQILVKKITNSASFQSMDLQVTQNNFYISGYSGTSFMFDTVSFVFTFQKIPKVISKFNLNGELQWAKAAGALRYGSFVNRIAIDLNENIYTMFTIGDSATIGNQTVFKIGWGDMILAKHDSSGNFISFQRIDMSAIAEGVWDIASDNMGDLYITGEFGGTAHFGNNTITSSNSRDLFLAKYTPNGACIGVYNFGNAKGLAVAIDNTNNPIVSGTFINTVNIGTTSFTCNNTYDAFVAKHDAITGINNQQKMASNNQLLIYANPNSGKCNITVPTDMLHQNNLVLSIYNSQGKIIQQQTVTTSQQKIKINIESEASGIYNAVLSNGTKSYSGKIVFE
ncbi:MAG: T9SS type A sorting domain-containing protein [Bacteroidetes bacterium]|nr:T9SS type A sorting domain-containing protein [Bacteroidota bacterium]MBP6413351.1 T9SS type A sorting domain-containing protein [Bacteroidia bacterium]